MSMIGAWFAKPAVKYGLILLAVLAIAGAVVYFQTSWFNKGVVSGAATVSNAVQTQTITTLDNARVKKEQADEAVRDTPYTDRVDGLR